MNYILDGYEIDDLASIHKQGLDIEIDWLFGALSPKLPESARIPASIDTYRSSPERQFAQRNVNVASIIQLPFHWPVGGRKYMAATDDRGKG